MSSSVRNILLVLIFILTKSTLVQAQLLSNLYPDDPEFTSCVNALNQQISNRDTIVNQFEANNPGQTMSRYFGNWAESRTEAQGAIDGKTIEAVIINGEIRNTDNNFLIGVQGCPHYIYPDRYNRDIRSNFNIALNNTNIKEQIACGSVIDYSNKTVYESVPVVGTDFELIYSNMNNPFSNKSRLVSGFFTQLQNEKSVLRLQISSGDQTLSTFNSFINLKNIEYKYLWDQSSDAILNNSFLSAALLNIKFEYQLKTRRYSITNYNPNPPYNIISFAAPEALEENWIPMANELTSVSIYKSDVWGLKGWTLSNHHYFDKGLSVLYLGNGQRIKYKSYKTLNDTVYGQVTLVVDKDLPGLVYKFSNDGKHLETINTDLKYTVYKFNYNPNHSLQSITDRHGQVTQFIYDSNLNIEKIISPKGLETTFLTNDNTISEIQTPGQKSYKIQYDEQRQLTRFEKPNQEVTVFSYDQYGDVLGEQKNTQQNQNFVVQILEQFTEMVFSKTFGQVRKFTQKLTFETEDTTEYDSENRQVKIEKKHYFTEKKETLYPHTTIEQTTSIDPIWADYSPFSRIETATTESNQNIRQIASTNTRYFYENTNNPLSLNQKIIESSIANYNSFYKIDTSNQFVYLRGPDQRAHLLYYDSKGNLIQSQPANQYPTDYTYQADGRLSKIQKGNEWVTFSYDQFGYLASQTNSKNQTTTFLNDPDGQVLEKTLPNQDKIKFEYTNGGEVKKITAPNSQIHQFQTSIGDFITNILTPNQKITYYEYDSDKRLVQIKKPSGKEINYNYKPLSANLQSISTPTGDYIIHEVDSRQRLKSMSSPDQIKTNIDWVHTQIQKQTWYDTDNSIIGQIDFNFKSDEFKINQIKINGQTVANMTYDNAGRISTINGSYYQYQYNEYAQGFTNYFGVLNSTYSLVDSAQGNQPTQIVNAQIKENPNLQLFLTMKRTFDTFGNASEFTLSTLKTDTGIYNNYYTLTPTYDANDRLVQITKNRKSYINNTEINSTDFINNYLYPPASNNNVKEYAQQSLPTTQPHKRTVATHSIDDQLTKLRGSINRDYQYTDDGDLKSMTNCFGTTNYDYDVFGNLKKVTLPDNKIIEYKVDSQNRRIKKLINGQIKEYYLWYDQLKLAAILDENKSPKLIYIYGPESQNTPSYVIHNNTTYKILHDPGLGSVRYVIEPTTQQIVQEIEYDEFGNMMKNSNPDFQPILFSGGLYDFDTKLYRFGARDYDPTVGRWTSKDPIGFAGGDTNLYAYVGGNPMSYVDPSGLSRLRFDNPGGSGSLLIYPGQEGTFGPPQFFNAGNFTTNPSGDPLTPESYGPIPTGKYTMGRYSDKNNISFGSGIFYIDGLAKYRPGIGVHAGRNSPYSKTQGCIRTTETALESLRKDPPTIITIGRQND